MSRKILHCQISHILQIYRFNTIPVKILDAYFEETDKLTLIELQGTLTSQNDLEKEQSWKTQHP